MSFVRRESRRSPEAIALFYALYRNKLRLSVHACHVCTLRAASQLGWAWPLHQLSTRNWLQHNDDKLVSFLMREGESNFLLRYAFLTDPLRTLKDTKRRVRALRKSRTDSPAPNRNRKSNQARRPANGSRRANRR